MEIVKADFMHIDAFRVYAQKCGRAQLSMYVNAQNDPDSYLKKRIDYAQGKGIPEGWPAMTTYFCFHENVIIGVIRVRNGSNDYIENVIGHVGYEVLPEMRGRGFASEMLLWVKQKQLLDKVIVTCEARNQASQRVIEKCGGRFLNRFQSEFEGEIIRYLLTPDE